MGFNPFYKNDACIRKARKKPELLVSDEEFIALAKAQGWSNSRINKEIEVSRNMPLGILVGQQFVKVK